MPDPFAPKGPPRTARESQRPVDGFLERMRRVGATDDEVAAVAEHWDNLTDDWTPEQRAEVLRWTDAELAAELAAVRAEMLAEEPTG